MTKVANAPANCTNKVIDPSIEAATEDSKKWCCVGSFWEIIIGATYGYFAFANPDQPTEECWVIPGQDRCLTAHQEGAQNMSAVFRLMFLIGFIHSLLCLGTW